MVATMAALGIAAAPTEGLALSARPATRPGWSRVRPRAVGRLAGGVTDPQCLPTAPRERVG
jgi:hypothetical protein